MNIHWKDNVPVTDELVAQAAIGFSKPTVMVSTGALTTKHLRVRKDAKGWFVRRKQYLVSATITGMVGFTPIVIFKAE